MVFWKRKPTAPVDAQIEEEDENDWVPEYARYLYPGQPTFIGPHQPGIIEQHIRTHLIELNATLQEHGIHTTQLDGGIEFTLNINTAETEPQNMYTVCLEQVIQGLGIRYLLATYTYGNLKYNKARTVLTPKFTSSNNREILYPDQDWFSIINLDQFTADLHGGILQLINNTTAALKTENLPVNLTNIMTRITLNTAHPILLDPNTVAGWLLPTRDRKYTPKHVRKETYIPQGYYEYIRASLPVSYLLAAYLPTYHTDQIETYALAEEPWAPEDQFEWAPRFGIFNLTGIQNMPANLALEMVNGTRTDLIRTAIPY